MPRPAATAPAKQGLLAIAWPIFVEQSLRILVGTVDVFMASHISDDAVAGLGVANQIVILFLIVFNFIAIGASVVITHHLGGRDRAGADQIAATAISANTWMGVGVSLGVFVFAAPILRLMQLHAAPLDYAVSFLTLMGGTLFLESMNMSIAAVLRAHRHTRDAMFVTLGQNILNVTGVCLALFGWFGLPKMGVPGIALASVFSRSAACIAFWILLGRRTRIRMPARDFIAISRRRLSRILRIGLPAAGEQFSYWIALMVVTTFVAHFGSEQLATQSYTLQVMRLVMIFSIALGLGTEILTGHLVGAGAYEEAYRELFKSLRLGFTFATITIMVVAAFAGQILGCFTQNAGIVAGGVFLLRLAVLLEPGRVFNLVIIFSLRATGDVRFPLQVAILGMWLIWVPLAWLLGVKLGLGLAGIWISMIVDEWTRGMIFYRRWKLRRWLPHAQRSRASILAETTGAEVAAI